MPTVQDYFTDIDNLPPAPQILPQLLRLLTDVDTDMGRIVELISLDAGLTAKVMQACNSAFLGAATPARDVAEAVNRLGFQSIYRMVAVVTGMRTLRPPTGLNLDPAALWRHSVTTALAAQLIAKEQNADEGVAFTAGLLHDLGKILLANYWKKAYATLAAEVAATPWEQAARERAAWSIDHAELGGHLLAKWQFSPNITAAVWHHHHPAQAAPHERITACVCLANAIAHTTEQPGDLAEVIVIPGHEDVLHILDLDTERLANYLAQTRENFDFINAMCRLNN
jgi:putative nucleotidyltransferase with HDIG domain